MNLKTIRIIHDLAKRCQMKIFSRNRIGNVADAPNRKESNDEEVGPRDIDAWNK